MSRRFWILAIALFVVGLLAAGWFLWLPEYRPALAEGERYGIDVSHYQGAIDWQQVAADDISFAYMKATEGDDLEDPLFDSNWEDAGRAGLDRGAYHFFSLCASGVAQAEQFLSVLPDDADMLPPAVDLELIGACNENSSASAVAEEVEAFAERVEAATDQTLVLYIGDDFEERYSVRERLDRPVWVRGWLRQPAGEWFIWQVGGYAHVEGVSGRVDLDVMRRPA